MDAQPSQILRPLMARARTYQVLDLSGRPLAFRPTLREVLDLVREWPRRTVFLVRRWAAEGGRLGLERQWLMSRGLDGTYRVTESPRHWTIRPPSR